MAFGSVNTLVEVNTNLTYARNLLVRLDDPDGNLNDGTWVTVDGVGADGHPQSENFKINLTGTTSATQTSRDTGGTPSTAKNTTKITAKRCGYQAVSSDGGQPTGVAIIF